MARLLFFDEYVFNVFKTLNTRITVQWLQHWCSIILSPPGGSISLALKQSPQSRLSEQNSEGQSSHDGVCCLSNVLFVTFNRVVYRNRECMCLPGSHTTHGLMEEPDDPGGEEVDGKIGASVYRQL